MTLPSVIRIFFAVDLPATTKKALGRVIGGLKKGSKTHAIRWSRPENLHITLQFLAEIQSEHVSALVSEVRAAIADVFHSFDLHLGAVHLFPNPYRPRVIVLDIAPQEPLAALASIIGQRIAALGYEIETREFRAHLTIGRIKHPHQLDLSFLSACTTADIEVIHVAEIALFRSEPQPEGSQYTLLEKFAS